MREVQLGGERSFIGAWFIPDTKVCDEVIRHFRDSPEQQAGEIGHAHEVNKEIKDSIDVIVEPKDFSNPPIRKYIINLMEVVRAYTEKFPTNQLLNPWGLTENINIQFYPPGAGYKKWHTERIGKQPPSVYRHLVFMTYLNDVTDAGGTEFLYQKLTATPQKGLTLIWPADWTHLHRGVVSPSQEKYIITGWLSFV